MSDFTFVDNSGEVLKELENKTAEILEAWGLQGENYAKKDCPVDTGRLRNSITHTRDEKSAIIGTDVDYAVPVETGHILPNGKYVSPKPFIRPAAENHGSEYETIAKKILSN